MSRSAVKPTDPAKVVILIGSTGNGKSTLGSFLIDPQQYEINPKFKRADSNKPETKYPLGHRVENKGYTICYVDTPGLNEGEEADMENMINVFKYVKQYGNVAAVIICCKLDGKIDAPFRQTVKYYTDLFRSCVGSNLFVAVTNVQSDSKSEAIRKRDNVDVGKNCANIAAAIKEIVGVDFTPATIAIDANPLSGSTDEYNASLSAREVIIDTILKSPLVSLKEMSFRKTPFMESQDREQVKEKQGKLEGYHSALERHSQLSGKLLQDIKSLANTLETTKSLLQSKMVEYEDKDSTQPQQVDSWSQNYGWTLSWHEEAYILKSKTPISEVLRSKPNTFEWRDIENGDHFNKGKLVGNWFRGVQARVTIYSKKQDIYRSRIDVLRTEIDNLKVQIAMDNSKITQYTDQHTQLQKDIDDLLKFTKDIQAEINFLSRTFIPIEEALERLNRYIKN